MSVTQPLNLPLDPDLIEETAAAILDALDDDALEALSHQDAPSAATLRGAVQDANSWEEIAEEFIYGPQAHPALMVHVLGHLLGEQEPMLASEGLSVEEPTIVRGSLYVQGPLEISSALWVLGDLVCEGVIRDMGPDSHVVVLGDLRAPGLITSGEFSVWGDAETLIILGQLNDNSLVIAGDVSTHILYEDDHDVVIQGMVSAQLHASADMAEDERFALMAAWIQPEFIVDVDNFEIDLEGLCDAMNQGDDPILSAPRVVGFGENI